MKKENITYWGILVDSDAAVSIVRNTDQLISEPQKSMHLTLEFFGGKAEKNIQVERLGEEVEILVTAYGTYEKNGVVANQGLYVPAESLAAVGLCSKNDVPHITVAISQETDEKGKRIGKAVETAKCNFSTPVEVKIKGRIAVFDGSNDYSFTIEE